MKKKLEREKIKELNLRGYNDNEIAKIINASVNGVRYIRKTILNLPHRIKEYFIDSNMSAIIVGTLLGDAYLGYVHKGCTSPKLTISHCLKQKEYTMYLYKELKSIMCPTIEYRKSKIIIVKEKQYKCQSTIRISSRNCKTLIEYRNAFYYNNKKIIPINFIFDKFNSKSLAILYMDDGSLDRNHHSYILNTQCFTKENLQEFSYFLKKKFNLEFNIKKDNSMYLKHRCNKTFENLIRPYLTKDMLYKLY